ncbi:hypothetical protein QBC41DRAFT_319681 [Cercophora samala]|uniref:2EXR domain-containing protein n=1 Tax=Cercophora samala TaxID=330535 RepID=A0AA40DBZ2_9PEZI|nr:hypothetical protein QBC41DRAFT_319681 [Cercophora samala]
MASQECEFRCFPRLPPELRAAIWRLTIHPRTVKIKLHRTWKDRRPYRPSPYRRQWPASDAFPYTALHTPTPTPPVLQVCRESRFELIRAGYAAAGSELVPLDQFPGDTQPRRYVWINWEIDTLDIGRVKWDDGIDGIARYAPIAPLVRHLMFSLEGLWGFHRPGQSSEAGDLRLFENARRLYVVYRPGGLGPVTAYKDCYWPCGPENVVIVDEQCEEIHPKRLENWKLTEESGRQRLEIGLLKLRELKAREMAALSNELSRQPVADSPELRMWSRSVRASRNG